ncbi:insulinase family protein [Salinimicrobium sp. MT39]|uniref:Insulinase family protein n=1 Tax=Salinimicrobium profundisediminis TaxID=2994553 RepID=A0A9X3CVT9_9FLAO|nr:insulinase family protein [Salinimicrobium profundisediminis]
MQQDEPLPLDPAVRYGKLKNGFTYYLKNVEDPQNAVRFDLIVKAGRYHEDGDQREYAHLLEHMLAKETKHFSTLRRYFSQDGRRRHAFTNTHSTRYFAIIPKNDEQVLNDGLQVLLDWAQGNAWKPESIAVERGAIEGEMRTTDPYRDWKTRKLEREVLKTMGYNPTDIKASLESIKNFNAEAFYRFYNDWYRPDLQAVIIVGDINVDSLENVIREKFGILKGPPYPPDPKKYLYPQTVHFGGKEHFAVVNDSLEPAVSMEILKVRPNFQQNPKSGVNYRSMLLQQLYMAVLDKRSKFVSQQYDPPFSYFWANYRPGILAGGQVNATQMSVKLKRDLQNMKEKFQRAVKTWKQLHLKITEGELEEAKNEIIDRNEFGQSTTVTQFAKIFKDHFVDGKAAPDPEVETALIKNLLKEISVGDLQSFMEENGDLNESTHFVFFKNKNIKIPDHEVFKQWKKEVDSITIKPLEAPAPTIESLEDAAKISVSLSVENIGVATNTIGASTVELPNGVKLLLKPSKPGAEIYRNRISIQAFRPNPVPLENPQRYLAAQVAPEVMLFSGAGPYSKYDLERFTNKKRLNLHFLMNKDSQIISGDSYVQDLPELLNLFYLHLLHPREDKEAFEAWRDKKKEELQGRNIRGSSSFVVDKIEQVWYPQLPNLDEKALRELTKEKVFTAVKEWFSSIEGYTFIVTGDFDTDRVLPILIRKLSGFPAKNRAHVIKDKEFHFPLVKMQEKLAFKNINAAYVRLFFPVKVEKDIKTKIHLRLLSRALNERIHDRLRDGSYSPISQGEYIDRENGIFAFKIIFDSSLGEEKKMITWAMEEFQNLRDHGVEKEWLENAITQELLSYESKFNNFLDYNNFWQNYLQSKVMSKENLEKEVLQYGTILEHFINFQDFNRAAKNYLSEENLLEFIGLPEHY